MLNVIDIYYKFISFKLYIEFVRQLYNININFEKNVHQYEKDFRKINVEIVNLNDSLSLSKPYLIQFFFIKFDKIYDIFIIIYIQIYIFYNSKIIKFDLIIYDIINEKRRMLVIKKNDIIMLIHRNNKNKQFVKNDFDDFDFINYKIYIFYKIINRKFKHSFIKC